jgi:hypothetical protein
MLACASRCCPVADAATLEVQNGVLSVVQAAGETTSLNLGRAPGAESGFVGFSRAFLFPEPYAPGMRKWPGAMPDAGAGCTFGLNNTSSCTGVASVHIAFGDADDAVTMKTRDAFAGVTSIAGGGGRDALTASDEALIDGGPGNDVVGLQAGNAIGGDGEDTLVVAPDDFGTSGDVTVNCGPGADKVEVAEDFNGTVSLDAASCPPLISPLVQRGPFSPGRPTVFYVPRDRIVHVPVFRASERVTGRMTLKRFGSGRPCASSVRFAAKAGRRVRPVFRLRPWVAKAVAPLSGHKGIPCMLRFNGTDPQGEPFDSSDHRGETGAGTSYVRFLFVSHRASNGRQPRR